jgi:hypothetical protein
MVPLDRSWHRVDEGSHILPNECSLVAIDILLRSHLDILETDGGCKLLPRDIWSPLNNGHALCQIDVQN